MLKQQCLKKHQYTANAVLSNVHTSIGVNTVTGLSSSSFSAYQCTTQGREVVQGLLKLDLETNSEQ